MGLLGCREACGAGGGVWTRQVHPHGAGWPPRSPTPDYRPATPWRPEPSARPSPTFQLPAVGQGWRQEGITWPRTPSVLLCALAGPRLPGPPLLGDICLPGATGRPAPCPTSPSPIPGASPTRGAPKQGEAGPTRGRVGGAGLRGWGRWSASGRGRAARGESPRVSESGPGSRGRVGASGVTPGEAPRPGFASWALGGRALAPPPGPPQLPLHKYQGQDLMCPWSQAERPASSHL